MQSRYPLDGGHGRLCLRSGVQQELERQRGRQRADGPDSVLLRRADHARILGDPGASVWVVEVSDFQCPYCRQFHDQSYG